LQFDKGWNKLFLVEAKGKLAMWHDVLYRLRALLGRAAVEAELDEELRFHLERQEEKYRRQGLPAADARRRARLDFGGGDAVREACRDARGTRWLEDLLQDLRYGFRALRQSLGFTAAAVLSLALGIGANCAIFTVLDALLLKTLPVEEPQRLVQVTIPSGEDFNYPLWPRFRDRQDVFSYMLAYGKGDFDLSDGGEKLPARGLYVSSDYFRTLGVTARLGRTLGAEDERPEAGPAVVLSYGFWQRRYGGDASVVGRAIRVEHYSLTVVGVAPPGFFGLDVGDGFDVAVPLHLASRFVTAADPLTVPEVKWLTVVGRLKPGMGATEAAARLGVWSKALFPVEGYPSYTAKKPAVLGLEGAARGLSDLRRSYSRPLLMLMAMVGLVLLIACANLANLLLARSGARQREIAVRLALGAGRGRLIRQLLTESALLSLGGAALGGALAKWGSAALVGAISSPEQHRFAFLDLAPDFRVLAFLAGIAVLTGALFGLAPALRATRLSPQDALKRNSRGMTERRGRWSLSRTLVAAQVALSVILVAGAGLFVRSFYTLLTEDMGFRRQGVLLVDMDARAGHSAVQQTGLVSEIETRLRQIPGVEAAACSEVTPISGRSWQWDVTPDDPAGPARKVHVFFNLISPEYFQAVGTNLLRGRGFTARDTAGSPKVAIVNETAARRLFPGVNPLGKAYRDRNTGGPYAVEIVGVAQNAKYRRLRDPVPPTVYLPIAQNPGPFPLIGTFELRFSGRLADVTARVREVVKQADPRIALEFRLLSAQVEDSLVLERLLAELAAGFAALALVLASVGVYGVVAYAVVRRRSEIGIRMAMGATRGSVVRLVLRDIASLLVAGLVVGTALVTACARLVASLLYGLKPCTTRPRWLRPAAC